VANQVGHAQPVLPGGVQGATSTHALTGYRANLPNCNPPPPAPATSILAGRTASRARCRCWPSAARLRAVSAVLRLTSARRRWSGFTEAPRCQGVSRLEWLEAGPTPSR
jgi:hypothetical protein